MNESTLEQLLEAFELSPNTTAKPFGSGLINHTYLLQNDKKYILQNINIEVFKKPEVIASNVRMCANYFQETRPTYKFITPILTASGKEYFINAGKFWRLTPFVINSCTFDQLSKPSHAFQAAKAVGEFAKATDGIPIEDFGETIPRFHDLSFRYAQFTEAIQNGNPQRIKQQKGLITKIKALSHICDTYEKIKHNPNIPIRVQHHDTKINNILFNKESELSICLCDLDTVMPGYFISDLGDMMRTYLSEANEEETDFTKVIARPEYYKAVIEGYLSEMQEILTSDEKAYLHYAGEFLIYMQALRFFTDYLNDDIYYSISYPENNLNRTLNQIVLLEGYFKLKR